MKKTVCVVLTMLITISAFCGCSLNHAQMGNISDNSTYSSTEKELDIDGQESGNPKEGLTVRKIKETIKTELRILGYTNCEFTEDLTKTEDGKTTTTFKFLDESVTVSITENSSEVEQILCWGYLETFNSHGVDADMVLGMAAVSCLTPLSSCDSSMDTESLFHNIVSTTPEIEDNGATYTYEKNGWEYILIATNVVVSATAKPVESN